MNKILVKIIILFFVISGSACSYKPIFSEKEYGFEIEEIIIDGEKDINRIINNKLKFIKSNGKKEKKRYTIKIKTEKKIEIVSKDSKGDPLKFEMSILVEYNIINGGSSMLSSKIEKNNVYNNDSDQFKLEQTEDIILKNLSDSASEIIISSIINLDDN